MSWVECYVAGEPPALLSVAFRSASRLRSRVLFLGARAAGPHCAKRVVLRLENYIVMCLIARSGAYLRAWAREPSPAYAPRRGWGYALYLLFKLTFTTNGSSARQQQGRISSWRR